MQVFRTAIGFIPKQNNLKPHPYPKNLRTPNSWVYTLDCELEAAMCVPASKSQPVSIGNRLFKTSTQNTHTKKKHKMKQKQGWTMVFHI